MKTIIHVALLIVLGFCNVPWSFSSEKMLQKDDINVEPIQGKPHHYFVSIKFQTIETVIVRTNRGQESLGKKHESYTLSDDEWIYNPETSIIIIKRNINDSRYIVRVAGKYHTPLCIALKEKIDPAHIQFVIDGKIGISGKDYLYDVSKNSIQLIACRTGQEKYFIQYRVKEGSVSIGSASTSELTLPLLKYLNFPVNGNAACIDRSGSRFSSQGINFKSVWLVQLIPAADGYIGKDILSGFWWDTETNELTLEEPVDVKRFSIMIYGEF